MTFLQYLKRTPSTRKKRFGPPAFYKTDNQLLRSQRIRVSALAFARQWAAAEWPKMATKLDLVRQLKPRNVKLWNHLRRLKPEEFPDFLHQLEMLKAPEDTYLQVWEITVHARSVIRDVIVKLIGEPKPTIAECFQSLNPSRRRGAPSPRRFDRCSHVTLRTQKCGRKFPFVRSPRFLEIKPILAKETIRV
jgi:hypothetical protein